MNVRFGSKARHVQRTSRCPLYPQKRTLVSVFCGNPGAASLVLGCSGTSNKIIQKGLASSHRQSGTVSSSGRWLRFGILPCRLDSRGGASVVAAMVAAQPKEIPMTKAKSKRKLAPRTNDSKTKTHNGVRRTTARKAAQLKSDAKPAAHQQRRSAPQPTARRESKKAHIIAMLQAPSGVTIEAMARAAKWQSHSIRGFLTGRRAREARAHSCAPVQTARMGASTGLHGSRGVSGGVVRCGKHDRLQRGQPNCRRTTRSRVCAISISVACGRAGRACSATGASSSVPPSAVCRFSPPPPGR